MGNLQCISYSFATSDRDSYCAPSSMILFKSLPADIGEGIESESSTVIFLYPRRASWRAVLQPHVPPPMMRIVESCVNWDILHQYALKAIRDRKRAMLLLWQYCGWKKVEGTRSTT